MQRLYLIHDGYFVITLLIKQKQLKIVAKLGTSNSTVNKEVCSFRGCLRGRRQKNLEIVAIPHTIQTVEIHTEVVVGLMDKFI